MAAGSIPGATVTDPTLHLTAYRVGPGQVLTETSDPQGQRTQSPREPTTNLVTQRPDALGKRTRHPDDSTGNLHVPIT